jgi:hypothetical protein
VSYRLRREDILDAWLAGDPPDQAEVLAWLFKLIEDPDSIEVTTVPITMGLPAYTAIVPGTLTAVTFSIVRSPPYLEHVAGIYLRRIESLA